MCQFFFTILDNIDRFNNDVLIYKKISALGLACQKMITHLKLQFALKHLNKLWYKEYCFWLKLNKYNWNTRHPHSLRIHCEFLLQSKANGDNSTSHLHEEQCSARTHATSFKRHSQLSTTWMKLEQLAMFCFDIYDIYKHITLRHQSVSSLVTEKGIAGGS